MQGVSKLLAVGEGVATRRLQDEIKCSFHQRIRRHLGPFGGEAADHDRFGAKPAPLDFPQDFDAVHVRHLHVERQQVGIQLLDLL